MLTTFLARFMGLWVVVTVMSMVANRAATFATMEALFADPALMWITGVFTLGLGLALVLAHNRWSEGALAAIVTFYGWAATIKGLLFLCLPPTAQMAFYQGLHFEQYFYGYVLVALVLGGYLIYGGFNAARRA
ncbi:MAG: hypothetical protein WA814_04290 [Candidatus Baltobacteraceae bacterium]